MSDLLDLVLEAHGGLDRWRKVDSVDVRLTLGGPFAAVKQHPDGIPDALVRIDVHRPKTLITPFPYRGRRGIFEPGRVRVQDTQGELISELISPRESFNGSDRLAPWTDLQFLYFVGYAFRSYFTMPFLLVENGVSVQEEARHKENGEEWRVLKVTFPLSMDAHTAEQRFYFNEKGLLVRNDYFVDVAHGSVAHYVYDHRNFNGFIFPTHRRVVMRDDTNRPLLSGSTIFSIDIHDILINPINSDK
jgi:hypothetical protein